MLIRTIASTGRLRWGLLLLCLLAVSLWGTSAFAQTNLQQDKDPLLECWDGLDNDGDGLTDAGEDPGCRNRLVASKEDPECDDKDGLGDPFDNADQDSLANYGEDPECETAWWDDESRARSAGGVPADGNGGVGDPGCTLPAGSGELAFLVLPFGWLMWRRRSA